MPATLSQSGSPVLANMNGGHSPTSVVAKRKARCRIPRLPRRNRRWRVNKAALVHLPDAAASSSSDARADGPTLADLKQSAHDRGVTLVEAADALLPPAAPGAEEAEAPIPLNEWQQRAVKQWAADDRLWTTQETVEINLRTFARTVLATSSPAPAAGCADECNPFVASCGAKFCTYEEMAAHKCSQPTAPTTPDVRHRDGGKD